MGRMVVMSSNAGGSLGEHFGNMEDPRSKSMGFTIAAALVHQLMEARDERWLLDLQRQLSCSAC